MTMGGTDPSDGVVSFSRHKWITSILIPVLVGIISTVLASFLLSFFGHQISLYTEHKNLVRSVQDIAIGYSKNWIDEHIGVPTYLNTSEGYCDATYVNNVAIVRVIYDDTNTCKAFFVTLPESGTENELMYPQTYHKFTKEKALGDVSFYDVAGTPEAIVGNISQGAPHMWYSERYYYVSEGNYYTFYFCSLDYGKVYTPYDPLYNMVELAAWTGDGEIWEGNLTATEQTLIVSDRKMAKPNTYGISSLSDDIISNTVLTFSPFDSRTLLANE